MIISGYDCWKRKGLSRRRKLESVGAETTVPVLNYNLFFMSYYTHCLCVHTLSNTGFIQPLAVQGGIGETADGKGIIAST